MACPKELTLTDATPGRVFWGFYPTPPFGSLDLSAMYTWPSEFDPSGSFFTMIHTFWSATEVAFLRSGGYVFPDTTILAEWNNNYFFFGYPARYGKPRAVDGLRFSWGNNPSASDANMISADVVPQAEKLQNVAGLSNWPSYNGTLENGWYFVEVHYVDAIYGIDEDYIFISIGCHTNLPRVWAQPGGAGPYPADDAANPLSRSRTSGVARLVSDAAFDWSAYIQYVLTVSGAGDSSFNLPQPGDFWNVVTPYSEIEYTNAGTDVGSTADTGFTVTFWQRDNFPFPNDVPIDLDHDPAETTMTFFISL